MGRFKGRYIHELAVTYPSYIEYLYSSCHQLYLYKLLNITQSRLDLRYLRLSFGKYNGQLLRCVPNSYLRWLVSVSIDTHTKLGACRLLSLRKPVVMPTNYQGDVDDAELALALQLQ